MVAEAATHVARSQVLDPKVLPTSLGTLALTIAVASFRLHPVEPFQTKKQHCGSAWHRAWQAAAEVTGSVGDNAVSGP